MSKKVVQEDDGEEYSEIPFLFDPDFWTPELVEFLMKVGVGHRIRRAVGTPPFRWTYGKWETFSEQEAIELFRAHGGISLAEVDRREAAPGVTATWSFEVMWADRQAKTWRLEEVAISTSGAWRVIEEFDQYVATGSLSEGAILDRRIAEQEAVDKELSFAVDEKDLDGVLRALAKGADPDADVGWIGIAAMVATFQGNTYLPILRALIDGGAALEGITIGNWKSQPPLWAAVRMGNLPAVRLLLELGADPNCSHLGRSVHSFEEDGGYDVGEFREIKRLLHEAEASDVARSARDPKTPRKTMQTRDDTL